MPFDTFEEIRSDILDRSGATAEANTADFLATTGTQIIRAYHEIANHHPFLWLRADPPAVIATIAPITLGTVIATLDSDAITFSSAPVPSVAGRKILFGGVNEFYRIATHVAGNAAAVLDTPFNGTTNLTATYTVFQDEYALDTDVRHIVGMIVAEDGTRIEQKPEDWILDNFPFPPDPVSPPRYFARIGEQRIRFEGYPDRARRIEYSHTIIPPDLVTGVTPIIPRNFRYVIADGGLFWLYLVRNDNRADPAGILFSGGREKMVEDDLRKRFEIRERAPSRGPWK